MAVVLEYALRLRKKGHEVRVYYPLLPYGSLQFHLRPGTLRYPVALVRGFFRNLLTRKNTVGWFREPIRVHPIPLIHPLFIKDSDACVATAWPTAYDVAAFPGRKGRGYYFIQDYEIWGSDKERVDKTYRLPLRQIVIAPWLADLMRSRFGRSGFAEIHNGVDLDFFRPPENRDWERPAVLMMYHTLPSKGSEDGLAALERISREKPGVKLRAFGLFDLPERYGFLEYHRDPSPGKLLELYRASTIFISPSRSEGWGLPVMEAMACGCAVLATEVGCVPVLNDNENMAVIPPSDAEALYLKLTTLIDTPKATRKMAERGLSTIAKHGWDAPAGKLELFLAPEKSASSSAVGS